MERDEKMVRGLLIVWVFYVEVIGEMLLEIGNGFGMYLSDC